MLHNIYFWFCLLCLAFGFCIYLLLTNRNLNKFIKFLLFRKYKIALFHPNKRIIRFRSWKIKKFIVMANRLIQDISSCLQEENLLVQEKRLYLGLVIDTKCYGSLLHAKRNLFVTVCHPFLEVKLAFLLKELILLEQSLRMLPSSNLTLEDVLEGKF